MVLQNGQFRVMFSPLDYDASVKFYRDGLALPVDHDWDYGVGDKGTVFIAGGGMVELLGMAPDAVYIQPQGMSLLIQVEDVDGFYEQVKARGLKIYQEPANYPWGHRIFRVKDPDGVVVSLFSPVKAG